MAALADLRVDEADAAKFDALLGAQRGAADAAGCVKGLCIAGAQGATGLWPEGVVSPPKAASLHGKASHVIFSRLAAPL